MNHLIFAGLLLSGAPIFAATSEGKLSQQLIPGKQAFEQVAEGMRQSPTTRNQILTRAELDAELKDLMNQFLWARQSIKGNLNPSDDDQLRRFATQASADPYAIDPLVRLVLAGEAYQQMLAAQKDFRGSNSLRASLDRITTHLIWVAGMKDRFIDKIMVAPSAPNSPLK